MSNNRSETAQLLFQLSKYALLLSVCMIMLLLVPFGYSAYRELFDKDPYRPAHHYYSNGPSKHQLLAPVFALIITVVIGFDGIINNDPKMLLYFTCASLGLFVISMSYPNFLNVLFLAPAFLALTLRYLLLNGDLVADEPLKQREARSHHRQPVPTSGQSTV